MTRTQWLTGRPKAGRFLLIALALSFGARGSAINSSAFTSNAVVINFDDLAGGNCNLCGPSVTTQYQLLGAVFRNPDFLGQETADTNLTPLIPNASAPNALYVFQGGQVNQPPASPFQILFSTPVTRTGFDFGSSVNAFLRLQAYSTGGQLIETLDFTGSPAPIGLAGFAGIQTSIGIARLDVSYHLASDVNRTLNFSIDNLRFENATPEPAASSLIGLGLLGMTIVCRNRR